jgi:hypothetical protein
VGIRSTVTSQVFIHFLVASQVFQDDGPKVERTKAAKTSSGSGPSLPSFSAPSIGGGIGVGSVALPLSIVALGGLGVAATTFDAGFSKFFNDTIIKVMCCAHGLLVSACCCTDS